MNNIKTCKQGNTSTHQNDLNRSPSDCPPDLCGACRQITLDRLLVTRERRAPIPSPWEDSGPVREAVFLEVHLDTPEKSTQTCPMCKLMHDAVWGGLECPGPTTVKLCMTDERRVVNVLNPSKAGVETRPGLMSPGSNELPQSGPPGLLAGSPNPEGLGKYVSIFADHGKPRILEFRLFTRFIDETNRSGIVVPLPISLQIMSATICAAENFPSPLAWS